MRKLALLVIAVLALAMVGTAAEKPPAAAISVSDFSRLEIFGGYSCLYLSNGESGSALTPAAMGANGWGVALTYNINRYLGLSAEFSSQYTGDFFGSNNLINGAGINHNTQVHNFLFGPTVTRRTRGKLTPFAHVLFGDSRMSSEPSIIVGATIYYATSRTAWDAWAMTVGGGADLKVNDRFSLRMAQFDYMHTNLNYNDWMSSYGVAVTGLPTSQNHFRYSAGVVIKMF
jgi:hypothetical protein